MLIFRKKLIVFKFFDSEDIFVTINDAVLSFIELPRDPRSTKVRHEITLSPFKITIHPNIG